MANVTKPVQEKLLERLRAALPKGHALLLMGSTAAIAHGVRTTVTTTDVDVSLILVADDRDVASQEAVKEFLAGLRVEAEKPAEDGSWFKVHLDVDGQAVQVDVIRGKSRDRASSQFIDRDLLKHVVQNATQFAEGVYLPTLTDLIVMKAWAAVDKERLVARGDDPTRNQTLADKYRGDVRDYAEFGLERGDLDANRIEALLGTMADHRAPQVRAVLEDEGAL